MLVKVTADDGSFGWGEIYAHVQPTIYAPVVAELLAPIYIGANPLHADMLWERAYNRTRDYGRRGMIINAISGIDIALWDLKGRCLGQPLAELLGGRWQERVEAYATGLYRTAASNQPAALAKEASDYVEQGFGTVKLKVGYGVDIDLVNIAAVRGAIGDGVGLAIDANHAYTPATAIDLGRRAADYAIAWFEEPVAPEDLAGYREVRARQPIPIAGGEVEHARYGFRDLLSARALDIAQPDLGGVGGLSEGLKVAALAATNGVRVQPHVWGTAVLLAASLHYIAYLPDLPGAIDSPRPMLESDRTEHPIRNLLGPNLVAEPPWVDVPTGPGLGVEINTEAAKPYLIDHTATTMADIARISSHS